MNLFALKVQLWCIKQNNMKGISELSNYLNSLNNKKNHEIWSM